MKKLLAIAALLSASALAHANLVVNGGFEQYTSVGAGTWATFGSGYGWTTAANGVEIRNAVAGFAAEGVRFAELDTNANGSIWQTIHTGANQTLKLTFSYAPRPGVSAGSNPIQVFWNNQSLATITGNGNQSSSWLDFSYGVTADASGSGVLKFRAIGVSDSYGGSLDNVSVTAVPEPQSISILLAGLGILAVMTRRRQRRT
jgi:hypothetical protein